MTLMLSGIHDAQRAMHARPRIAQISGLFLLWVMALLTGCATGPNANPRDPLEPLNRQVFKFNDVVDKAVLKPVATVYRDVTPVPVRKGVVNFFDNLTDVWSGVNNALQLKGVAAVDSLARFGINTFIGVGGLFDVASDLNIEKHTKDFGHTLGYWGVGPGPYLVLPLLGPSTLRDTLARTVDAQGDLWSFVEHVPLRNSGTLLWVVETRADLLKVTSMLDQMAFDRYTFSRDAHLQRRRSTIYDGNPPEELPSDPATGQ